MNENPDPDDPSVPEESFHLPPRVASVLGHSVPLGARPAGYTALFRRPQGRPRLASLSVSIIR